MSILKKRITRVIAFILSCALIFLSVFMLCNSYKNSNYRNNPENSEFVLDCVYNNQSDMQKFFVQLWALGVMYLRNLDDKGNFNGNEYLKKSTEDVLKSMNLMDENGEIQIPEYGNLQYSVSWKNNELTNSDDASFENKNFLLEQKNTKITNVPYFMNFNVRNLYYTTSNYGETYYYLGDWIRPSAVCIYDFDTSDLKYYYDNRGAKKYFKIDGSTPVPTYEEYYGESYSNYMEYAYNEEEIKYEIIPQIPDNPDSLNYRIYGNGFYTSDGKFVNFSDFNEEIGNENNLIIKISPSPELQAQINAAIEIENKSSKEMEEAVLSVIPIVALAGILMIYVFVAGGYDINRKKFVLKWFDKIWVELLIVFIPFAIVIIESLLFESPEFIGIGLSSDVLLKGYRLPLFWGSMITALYALTAVSINSIITRLKCRSFWKTSFFGLIFMELRHCASRIRKGLITHEMMRNDIFVRRFLLRCAGAIGLGFVALLVALSAGAIELVFFEAIIIICGFIYFNLRDYKEFTKLSEHITQMNNGDYSNHEVTEDSVIYGMTQKLNSVSDSIQSTVENQVKSERMKIELVTNVSHDLKTPLTSIISYINLLSAEQLSPEARDYVTILEQKSERLKAIVADVFDLAKATSRTDITMEKLDLVVLTNQLLGDLADKISQSERDVRTNITIHSAPVAGDGKKLYRVMQNLIDNALKYSMENTRVYINVFQEENEVVFVIKNTASYEMTFTPEEIMERFTRGDKARTTEGNGLGLSIAKSFTEACGGKFDVEVDGDNFIAYIKFNII